MGCFPFTNYHFQMGVTEMGFTEHIGHNPLHPRALQGWAVDTFDNEKIQAASCQKRLISGLLASIALKLSTLHRSCCSLHAKQVL